MSTITTTITAIQDTGGKDLASFDFKSAWLRCRKTEVEAQASRMDFVQVKHQLEVHHDWTWSELRQAAKNAGVPDDAEITTTEFEGVQLVWYTERDETDEERLERQSNALTIHKGASERLLKEIEEFLSTNSMDAAKTRGV